MSYRPPFLVKVINRNAKLSTKTLQICSNCKAESQASRDPTKSKAHSLSTSLLPFTPHMLLLIKMCFSSGIPKGNQVKMLTTLLVKDVDNVNFGQLEVTSSNCSDILSLQ